MIDSRLDSCTVLASKCWRCTCWARCSRSRNGSSNNSATAARGQRSALGGRTGAGTGT
ncbi:Uncharacterised protein [Bordetella pertussis]|nr:Uncharacterised protein [Bordetella pertussis]